MSIKTSCLYFVLSLFGTSAFALSSLEISVDTGRDAVSGQTLVLKLNSSSSSSEIKVFKVSSGSDSRPSANVSNVNPERVYPKYLSKINNQSYTNMIFYKGGFAIAGINPTSLTKLELKDNSSVQVPISTCIDQGIPCTLGLIILYPQDAETIFQAMKNVGKENTMISVGDGINRKVMNGEE